MKGFYAAILSLCFCFLFHPLFAQTGVETVSFPGFKENKGQWHDNVLFRSELPNGKFYLEEDGFTFDLFDGAEMHSLMESIHGSTAKMEPSPNKVHFHAYRAKFQGASSQPGIKKKFASRTYYNYFKGKDPSNWARKVRSFQEIRLTELYPGVDLKVYRPEGRKSAIKYDLLVHPNTNPDQINIDYEGLEKLKVRSNGDLIIKTSVGKVVEQSPKAYQTIEGAEVDVPCRYELEDNTLSFVFPQGYDSTEQLVIDPTLEFSTYSGSFSNNFGYTATFDSDGFLYSGSSAFGDNYPTTSGAYQGTWAGGTGFSSLAGTDIAISKYDTSGTFMVWSTLIGGNSDELPHSIIVNQQDELFVLGTTSSPNFPVTMNAYDTTFGGGPGQAMNGLGVDYINGSDIIVSRFSNDGSNLQGSTFIGGSDNDGLNTVGDLRYNYADEVRGEIYIDDSNDCYIVSCTQSNDFPVTTGTYQDTYGGGGQDGCLFKLTNSLDSLQWSTYFGGSGEDAAYSIVLDPSRNIYISGGTNSNDLPTTTGVIDTSYTGGRSDAFMASFSNDGQTLQKSTYWGSSEYDQSYFIELDSDNHPHLLGQTEVMDSTYIINSTYATPNSGQYITQFNNAMDSVIWSTVFGSGSGNIDISPTSFLVDVCHKIYLSGWGGDVNDFGGLNNNTGGTNGMDITGNAYQSSTDGSDFYIMVLNDDASGIVYGSFMGGGTSHEHVDGGTSRFDRKGKIYQSVCAGCGNGTSNNSDFPIKPNPGAVSSTNNNSCNNAVFKFDFGLPITIADISAPPQACISDTIEFDNQSKGGQVFQWTFGDGDSSQAFEPTHHYDSPGTYTIKLAVYDSATCNLADSTYETIEILDDSTFSLANDTVCKGQQVDIGPLGADTSYFYEWSPVTGLANDTLPVTSASPDTTTDYILLQYEGICTDTFLQRLVVQDIILNAPPDTFLCQPSDNIFMTATHEGTADSLIWSTDTSFSDTLNSPLSDSSITVSPDSTQNYHVKGIGYNGCPWMDSVQVEYLPMELELELTDTGNCAPATVTVTDSSSGAESFMWDFGNNDTVVDSTQVTRVYNTEGSYSIQLTGTSACGDQDTLVENFTVHPQLQLDIPDDTILCDTVPILLSANSNGTATSFHWSGFQTFQDTINNSPMDSTIIVNSEDNQNFFINASNPGCETIDSVYVGVFSSQTTVDTDTFICPNDTVELRVYNQVPSQPLTHDWSPDDAIIGSDTTTQITVAPQSTTLFSVRSENSKGCEDLNTVEVSVASLTDTSAEAYSDQDSIVSGGSTMIHALPSGDFDYYWTPEESLSNPTAPNTQASPEKTTTYQLKMTEKGACASMDSVTIEVYDVICGEPDIFIPNAFTPNDDGENDVLYVRGNNIREMYLQVFTRWGEKVFETKDQSKGWDGNYKGKPMDPDVYVYHLEITCVGGEEFFEKGNVTLIR